MRHYRPALRNGLPIEQDAAFDAGWHGRWLRECYRLLRIDTHLYVFCSDHHLGDFRAAILAAGFGLKRTLVWVKDAWTSGDLDGDWGHQTEFVVFAHKGRRALNGERRGNVIEARRVPPGQLQHPTEKPVRVLRPLILASTEPGETILDPFAGSGSLGVAAREEGRDAVLIEQDDIWVDVAEGRLAQDVLFGT